MTIPFPFDFFCPVIFFFLAYIFPFLVDKGLRVPGSVYMIARCSLMPRRYLIPPLGCGNGSFLDGVVGMRCYLSIFRDEDRS